MNINTMDLFFGYNMRVGDVNGLTKSAAKYAELAKTADTAEQREGYAKAVTQINNDVLPKLQQEMNTLGHQLGLADDNIGQVLSKKALEEKNEKNTLSLLEYIADGTPTYSSKYQSGNIFSKNI
ncbi:hypothetical protein J8L73_19075 [Pseudoalteromonas sp. MMG006]|uniref:hypothetical protein n=1 Tax=Pseudoalteromonas sp. MMG006 TaxID=2822683 RepID=UPI001B3936CA|nr:hypothetical protein [Pseudoalteromonas sp. MMG006]MBQ4801193.1 hypothetical protein [Pseudoalteromonas sp. MMG006]